MFVNSQKGITIQYVMSWQNHFPGFDVKVEWYVIIIVHNNRVLSYVDRYSSRIQHVL